MSPLSLPTSGDGGLAIVAAQKLPFQVK